MKQFLNLIILLAFCVGMLPISSFAETLPGGLDNAQPLYLAWEIQSTPEATPTREAMKAYIALGSDEYLGVIQPTPNPEGLQDYLAIEKLDKNKNLNYYTTISEKYQSGDTEQTWTLYVLSLEDENCKLAVKRLYGTLTSGAKLELYQEDGTTLVKDLSKATASSAISVSVQPGRYVVKYTVPEVKKYTLTVDGTSEKVAAGSAVSKTAPAKTGYSFKNWTVSGVTVTSATANPLKFTMPENNVTLTTNYTVNSYTLTVNGTSSKTAYGSSVSQKAPTKTGSTFTHWTVTGISVKDSSANPLVFTMPANNVTLTACYETNTYTVNGTITLQSGWNLIAMPFTKLISVTSAGKNMGEIEVYRMGKGAFSRSKLSELAQGEAAWLYHDSETTAELILSGECAYGETTDFPDHSSSQWNFLGLQAVCDANGNLREPEEELPKDTRGWNPEKKKFEIISGKSLIFSGYFIK